MKRLISLAVALMIILSAFCITGISVGATGDSFEDTFNDLNSVSEKIGAWDNFPSHPEFGLSVAGRTNTASENSLIYSFADKAITAASVGFVEYHGFFSAADYEISVYSGGVWESVSTTASAESNISGYESSNFKLVTVSADSLPEDAISLKITLKNSVAWTLFIDNISLELVDCTSSGDDKPVALYTDDLTNIEKVSRSEGNWISYASHPEFGASVAGRQDTETENYLYYTFGDGEISSVEIDLIVYSGFFLETDCLLSVRGTDSDEWTDISFSTSPESNIAGYETAAFKKITLKAASVPKAVKQLRIQLNNGVAWTLFVDRVKVEGCSLLTKQEVYNEALLTYTDKSGTELDYYVVTPANYDSSKEYPLVFFLHGVGGETDQSGYIHLRNRLFKNGFECILLAPLANREKNQWWVSYDGVLYTANKSGIYNQDEITPTSAFNAARSLLIKTQNDYSVDTSKIYAIGVSMGGYATWEMITRYPEMFSAAVPICGGNDPTKADKILDMPIWTFHGDKDEAVSIDATRSMVEALKEKGSSVIKYTEYTGLDHGIWFKVFDEPEMLPWLFAQTRQTEIKSDEDTADTTESFVDPLENYDLMDSHTDGWDIFNPHPETGLSVIGRKSDDSTAAIYYSFDGKNIVSAKLILQLVPQNADIQNDIIVEGLDGTTNEWKKLALSLGEATALGSSVFSSAEVEVSGFPEQTSKIRISLNNEVLWAVLIDEVALGLVGGGMQSERKWTVVDGLDDYRYISDYSNNLKLYTPHPETGLNVLAKRNAKRGYITYNYPGCEIKDFEIQLQLAPEFFLQERDLLIQYRLAGETKFESINVLCGKTEAINDTFATINVTPESLLPNNVEEIKIMLYNDVAWTLMIDNVKLDISGDFSIPATGDSSMNVIYAFMLLVLATFTVMLSGKVLYKKVNY